MSNKLKKINIKNLDHNKINIYEKSYKNLFIYYIGFVTVKDFSYPSINNANPLNLIINKINEYIKKSNGNKYFMLAPTDESRAHQKSMKI